MEAIVSKTELRTHDLSTLGLRKDPASAEQSTFWTGKSMFVSTLYNGQAMYFNTSDASTVVGNNVTQLISRKYSTEIIFLRRLKVTATCTQVNGSGSNWYFGLSITISNIQSSASKTGVSDSISVPANTETIKDYDTSLSVTPSGPILLTGDDYATLSIWGHGANATVKNARITINILDYTRWYFQFN